MNTYEITFTRENGTVGTDKFTAANEREARRDFKEVYRHGNGTITSVELIRENVCATKQQERDALKKIREIVATLGPQSYVATAFEGCFEDAEQNIENDFGLSMKQRVESAERKIDRLNEELEESRKDYEAAHAAAHLVAEEKDAEIARLKAELEAAQAATITPDDVTDCVQLAEQTIYELETLTREAAEEIVKYADNPTCTEFVRAVEAHRSHAGQLEFYKALKTRLMDARKAGA